MGMTASLTALEKEQIDDLLLNPERVMMFLDPYEEDAEPVLSLDLDKSWHGIHWLLCGEVDSAPRPLGWAILGGEEVGEDLGYGPARLLHEDEVAEVAAALAGITREELTRRFDGPRMMKAGIYPETWDRGPEELEYLLDYFDQLSFHYQQAASRKQGMLLAIT